MKTLDQVEPRTAINAVNTPGAGNSQFRITQSGSYYLTENLQGAVGMAAIEITASNVSIDLCGFTMVGVAGSGGAIFDTGALQNITVRNGIIQGFGGGVSLGNSSGVRFEELTVRNCTGGGIEAATSVVITRCAAIQTGGNGISVVTGGTITDCVSNLNAGDGINAGGGSVVSCCTVGTNSLNGIRAVGSCTLTECVVYGSGLVGINLTASGTRVSNCTSTASTQHGILSVNGCTIEGCIARANTLDGIRVSTDCVVRGNTCDRNGNGAGDGAGIMATSFDNHIEDNTCLECDRGIQTTGGRNLIVRNVCSGNTTNWDISVGNICLVVNAATTAAFSGNAGGVAPGSTDPNANYSY